MDLDSILVSTGYPVAYNHFKKPPQTPYIVYLFTDSNNFSADNRAYAKINRYQIELYTNKKDNAAEQNVENILDNAEIFYDKSEIYIESEGLFQTLYEIEV